MKVMVLVKASQESEAGEMPSEKLLTEMGQFNQQLVAAGIMLAGEGLHPSSRGVRVRFQGKNRTVTDGPFAETQELIAGYWLWQVKSMEEAIEWVKRCPNPMESASEIEIRRVFETADFGEAFTPELKQQEDKMRDEIERYSLDPPRIVENQELLIAGPRLTYTFETRQNIPYQWEKFAPHRGRVAGQMGSTAYGVCWNYKPGVGFDYLTGVQIQNGAKTSPEFTEIRIPAGRYAVFTHRKHVSAIAETLEAIWSKWLPNSGHQAAETPSFERYTESYDPPTGTGGFEIWLPLKS